MTESPLQKIRNDYALASLDVGDVSPDPIVQLERWMHEAIAAEVAEPTAMTLATVGSDGAPSARVVLCKGISPEGLVFFTNYESHKGQELAANPRAAVVFFWKELERQVRVSGVTAKVPREQSEAYFRMRPVGSRVGAWASAQSEPVSSRAELERRFAEADAKYQGSEVPLPPYWGGYRLVPARIELWQGRTSRLHDRLRYTREGGAWTLTRLCP